MTRRMTLDTRAAGAKRALIATALAIAAAGAPIGTFAQTAAAPPELTVASHIKAENSDGIGANKRIAISSFVVQFVRDQGIERDAGSFGMFRAQSATYFVQTRGADPALLQSVADKLYDGFAAELASAGITVVPQAELDATAQFQEIRKTAPKVPLTDSLEVGARKDKHMAVNVLVTAKGLPLIMHGVSDKKWMPASARDYGSLQAVVLGSAQAAQALQAPLVNVRMTVSMVEQKGSGSGGASNFGSFTVKTASWKFESDPSPRFVDEGTALMLHGSNLSGLPSSRNVLQLTKPVPITGLELTAEKGEGGNSRGSGLLGAIARAATGGSEQGADAYIDIEPANFVGNVAQSGARVLKLFVSALMAPK